MQEILRQQQLHREGVILDDESDTLDETDSPTVAEQQENSPRVALLKQLASAFLTGLRKLQTAEYKAVVNKEQVLSDEEQSQVRKRTGAI